MFQPKRTKYRKQMKGRNRGLAQKGNSLDFGAFGLKATSRGQITSRQIEAARRAMTRHVKRGAKIWIRIFPDKPIAKKLLWIQQGRALPKKLFLNALDENKPKCVQGYTLGEHVLFLQIKLPKLSNPGPWKGIGRSTPGSARFIRLW